MKLGLIIKVNSVYISLIIHVVFAFVKKTLCEKYGEVGTVKYVYVCLCLVYRPLVIKAQFIVIITFDL